MVGYIDVIKDIWEEVATIVRTTEIGKFSVTIGLHQGST